MATSTRQWAHRKLDATNTNLMNAIQHLEDIADRYEGQHLHISQPLTALQLVIHECATLTERMKGEF